MTEEREKILDLLYDNPIEIGHWVGFRDLTQLHNKWLRDFLYRDDDQTLQAHRGSFKTTTLSLFFAIHTIIKPNETIIYMRKTGGDVTEIARQTIRILQSGCMQRITQILYNKDLVLIRATGNEILTNLMTGVKGSSQIVGLGIGTSITGKHADIIVTDDIINVNDRISMAEREHTKLAYQELQNIKNRGGRFINTGTPWHKDDAFSLMPNIKKYDCYSTGLISKKQLDDIKESMSPSLFAANYELRHIASEDVIFDNPTLHGDPAMCEQGIMQVDSAFHGEDFTAWSIINKVGGKYYVYGKMKRRHVEDCYDLIKSDYDKFMCGKLYNEDNADKGMVAKDFRRIGMKTITYHEDMNKYLKIVTYLKAIWKDIVFVEGTDEQYIEQICDYFEEAEHDDAPDSLASLARIIYKPARNPNEEYTPLY